MHSMAEHSANISGIASESRDVLRPGTLALSAAASIDVLNLMLVESPLNAG